MVNSGGVATNNRNASQIDPIDSNHQPLVSVIVSVFNSQDFLEFSLKSICDQSYPNWEMIVVDDASTDQSFRILESFTDPRIKVLRHSSNQGLSSGLNTAIKHAKGKYLARHDSDDRSEPNRLAEQVAYLESHPRVGVLGGQMAFCIGGLEGESLMTPVSDDVSRFLLQGNALFHPTVMIRRSSLDELSHFYDPRYRNAQDYDLWCRLAGVTQLANTSDVVVMYELHERQQTMMHRNRQRRFALEIQAKFLWNSSLHRDFAVSQLFRGLISLSRHFLAWALYGLLGQFRGIFAKDNPCAE